jgi:hypothetical protein
MVPDRYNTVVCLDSELLAHYSKEKAYNQAHSAD